MSIYFNLKLHQKKSGKWLTSVQAHYAFSSDDLKEAVETVLVHDLPSDGAALVLETRLHQVNGVHRRSSGGFGTMRFIGKAGENDPK